MPSEAPVRTEPAVKTQGLKQITFHEEGVASYYGRRFHGRQTANGEKFNKNAYTAAHPTLPFGTVVLVENLKNGKSIVLRINDRGPFVKGRVIDVSKEAARKLDFIREGLTKVRVYVIS